MKPNITNRIILLISALVFSTMVFGSDPRSDYLYPAATDIPAAWVCLIVFLLSYVLVMTEERSQLRKSKPVILAAGIIWAIIGWQAPKYNVPHEALEEALTHDLDEYGGLLLFLLTAMTYISTLQAAGVFEKLRAWLVGLGFSYRSLFWVTGVLAFCLSPIADNMTTALVMGTVIMALGKDSPKFVSIGCVNIVVAANAGGAFSPFGDITTLMMWQAGRVEFAEFFALILPSMASFIVPAAIMTAFIPSGKPKKIEETVKLHRGAGIIVILFIVTISMAITFEQMLGLPSFMGMMTGLSLLMFFAYFLRRTRRESEGELDIFRAVAASEWDTLLFFFGIIFSVGGLAFCGWLVLASDVMYGTWGATNANIVVGAASAIVDNIPVMFAVLSMGPEMDHFQWLLVTLTCGIGGSLLSIGSAAGVALMGTARGVYTFGSHLKWMPVIALGYVAGIVVHFLVNG